MTLRDIILGMLCRIDCKRKALTSSGNGLHTEEWFLAIYLNTAHPLYQGIIIIIIFLHAHSYFIYLFIFKHLYWSIFALQWCIRFCFITVNQLYIYIYPHISSLLHLPPFHLPYPTPLGGHKAAS